MSDHDALVVHDDDDLLPVPPEVLAERRPGTPFVMPPQSMVPTQAPALAKLIDQKQDVAVAIESWMKAQQFIRESAIKRSMPEHWVLNKTGDREMAIPGKTPLKLAQQGYGINVFPLGPPEMIDKEDGSRTCTIPGWAFSSVTGQVITYLVGSRNSKEKFTGRGPDAPEHSEAIHEEDLKKAAYQNLVRRAILELSGLGSMPRSELERLGLDTTRCQMGHGYSGGSGRRATKVADEGIPEQAAALWNECLRIAGGDIKDAKAVLKKITSSDKFQGWNDHTRITAQWQIDAARKQLVQHPGYREGASDGGKLNV